MIIGATFFIGSLLCWGFQLMEKILKPEEDVELIKEVDKEVETDWVRSSEAKYSMVFFSPSCTPMWWWWCVGVEHGAEVGAEG